MNPIIRPPHPSENPDALDANVVTPDCFSFLRDSYRLLNIPYVRNKNSHSQELEHRLASGLPRGGVGRDGKRTNSPVR